MKAFIKQDKDPLFVEVSICMGLIGHCKRRTRNPCQYCVKVPPYYDWRMYLKNLRETMMEIPDDELR